MEKTTYCSICNIISQGILAEENINEWLEYSYSGEEVPPLSVQKLTDMLNNRILLSKLTERYPGTEFPFEMDVLRKFILQTTIDKDDTIDKSIFFVGNSIVKEFDLNPINLSGFLLNKSQMTTHLKDCLNLEQKKTEDEEEIGNDVDKSIRFARDLLNNAIERAKKKGLAEPSEVLEIKLFDQEKMTRRSIDELER